MFSFFKRRVKFHTNPLTVDIHSHLIPAIDDGSKSMEESIFLLKGLKELGYKKIITTPHIMLNSYNNTKESIFQGLQELKKEVKKEQIDVEIEAAAEYYMDDGFRFLLDRQELLPISNRYILFETSFVNRFLDLESVIHDIILAGYKPLMAHPERYQYIKDIKSEYSELKRLGVFFQVNINSLYGYYGRTAQKNAIYLSNSGMIDFLGSDLHNNRHLLSLQKAVKTSLYSNAMENNPIQNNIL